MPNMISRRVLLLDDDVVLLRLLSRQLTSRGFEIVAHSDAKEALDAVSRYPIDAAVLDYSLDGTTGLDVLNRLNQIDPTIAVVMLSGTIDVLSAVEAIRRGADDVLLKPPEIEILQARLDTGLERTAQLRAQRLLSAQVSDPYGIMDPSTPMRRLRQQLDHAASRDFPLLLVGEPGAGKRAIAEMAHRLSLQASGRLFTVGVADRTADEVDAALTHVHHELTQIVGAPGARAAHSLLLDDVGVLASSTQQLIAHLLDAPGLARIIVTTGRNLADDARGGLLSTTLHQRLAVLPIAVPSLRERGSNAIGALAMRILEQLRTEGGEGPDAFEAAALDWITTCSWPGNVPQLRDVISAGFVRAGTGPQLRLAHLASAFPGRDGVGRAADEDDWSLQSAERRQIAAVLQMVSHNRSQAARLLGITRTTLYKKMAEYGLSQPEG